MHTFSQKRRRLRICVRVYTIFTSSFVIYARATREHNISAIIACTANVRVRRFKCTWYKNETGLTQHTHTHSQEWLSDVTQGGTELCCRSKSLGLRDWLKATPGQQLPGLKLSSSFGSSFVLSVPQYNSTDLALQLVYIYILSLGTAKCFASLAAVPLRDNVRSYNRKNRAAIAAVI